MTTPAPPALPSGALERMVAQCVAGSTRFGVSNAVLVWTPRTRPDAAIPAAAHYLRCAGAPHGAISPGDNDALDALATVSAAHLLRLDDGGDSAAASPIVQAFTEGAALYVGDLNALNEHQLRCVALAEAVIGGGSSFVAVPLWAGAGQAGGRPRPAAVLQIVLSAAHSPRRELLALVRSAAASTGLGCPAAIASWEPKAPPPLVILKDTPVAVGAEPPQLRVKEEAAAAARRAGRAAALRAAAAAPSRRHGAHTEVKGAPQAPAAPPLGPDIAGMSLHKGEAPTPRAPAAPVVTTEELVAPPEDLSQAKDLGEAYGGGSDDDATDVAEMEGVGSPSSQVLPESLSPRQRQGRAPPRPPPPPRRRRQVPP